MKFPNFQAYVIKKGLYSWFFNHLKFDNFTLDIDSSVMMRYDEQQGSAKGYTSNKPGRKSQHPIMAFVAEIAIQSRNQSRNRRQYKPVRKNGPSRDDLSW